MAQEFGEALGVFHFFHSPSHPGHFLVIPAFPHPAVLTLVLPRVVCVLSLIAEPQGSLLGQADVPQVSFLLLLAAALPQGHPWETAGTRPDASISEEKPCP